MTSVTDDNVFNLAVEGTFDDCQSIMKGLFGDLEFKDHYALGSVNSINWARILAQVVYYFYAAFRVMQSTGCERVRFAVPTGNFGDIFAGFMAARMGLPIGKLVLATNENNSAIIKIRINATLNVLSFDFLNSLTQPITKYDAENATKGVIAKNILAAALPEINVKNIHAKKNV